MLYVARIKSLNLKIKILNINLKKYLFRIFKNKLIIMEKVYHSFDVYYNKDSEGGINPFDENLGIEWMIPKNKIKLSEKDLKWERLNMI